MGPVPRFLAPRLAVHTTLVKQPVVGPPREIVPVADAGAHTKMPTQHPLQEHTRDASTQHLPSDRTLDASTQCHHLPAEQLTEAGCPGASKVAEHRTTPSHRMQWRLQTSLFRHPPLHRVRGLTEVYRMEPQPPTPTMTNVAAGTVKSRSTGSSRSQAVPGRHLQSLCAKPARATDRYRPSGNVIPRPTDTSQNHWLRTLPKDLTESAAAHHVRDLKPDFETPISNAVSDLLHVSVLQWSAGAGRCKPTQLVTAMCGPFHSLLLQEAHDHVPHISSQFYAYTDGEGLAILLNTDPFVPNVGPHSAGCARTPAQTTELARRINHVMLGPPAQRGCQET